MKFRLSFCNPFTPIIEDLGMKNDSEIIDCFKNIPWEDFLDRIVKVDKDKLDYSPTLEIIDTSTKHAISISALGDGVWLVFYKRPKLVSKWFGLTQILNENYNTEVEVGNQEQVIEFIQALLENNHSHLENKILD
ncbi:MAG: hypothetical protein K9H61_06280 [Bacteroidia bacterium]|nr:hypothetical protein [Bacteroidia bacterium]MCF8425279.1 hypothetical protein [Bacteroidia bacterium]MCF8446585.1 hypothetical protein [Bacteroidia bacterium]